jgi:hypothetical protein
MKAKKVHESHDLGGLLKPKSGDEVVDAFKKASISQQIEVLKDVGGDTIVPEEGWPLIVKIKKKIVEPDIRKYFASSGIEPILYSVQLKYEVDSPTIGQFFKIWVRKDESIPFVMIEQLDDEGDAVRMYLKTMDNKKSKFTYAKSVDEFWAWFMKAGYRRMMNESLSDLLKPKAKEDVIEAFKNQSVSDQTDFLYANNFNQEIIPIEHWPLIMQIKDQLKNNESFDIQFRVRRNNDIFNPEGYPIGTVFYIHPRDDDWAGTIEVEQYNNELEAVRVSVNNQYTQEGYIEDYRGFIKWLNDDFIYPHNKAGYSFKQINESIFKPKSKEDIKKDIMTLDEYRRLVRIEQDANMYSFFVDNRIRKKMDEIVEKGYNDLKTPNETFNALVTYYKLL